MNKRISDNIIVCWFEVVWWQLQALMNSKAFYLELVSYLWKQFMMKFDQWMDAKEIFLIYFASFIEFSQGWYFFFDSYNTISKDLLTKPNVSREEVLTFIREVYLLLIAFILNSLLLDYLLVCIHLLYGHYLPSLILLLNRPLTWSYLSLASVIDWVWRLPISVLPLYDLLNFYGHQSISIISFNVHPWVLLLSHNSSQ